MSSGPVTSHLHSWSSAKTARATRNGKERLAIQNARAPVAQLAVGPHFGKMAPAAPAFVIVRLHHAQIALMHRRGDEQLGEEVRLIIIRHPHLCFQARPDHLVTPQWL